MYQTPSQTQSWNPNGGPPPTGNWSQQPPNTPNGSFQQRPSSGNQLPNLQSQGGGQQQPPTMQTLQPQQHPAEYRQLPQLPPPPHQPQMYQPPYQQAMPYPQQQPAPRQRTAIACRYCRRRKIRCSGFDQNEDGRCTNCVRFSQECVFTPVSAQAQAFVPAHTVYRGANPPPNTQLYGAYGQPLPPQGNNRDSFPGAGATNGPPQQAGQYPPPPPGYAQGQMYPGQQPPPDQSSATPSNGQKRGTDEPQTPTLPSSGPGGPANGSRDGQQQPYGYPDPNEKLGPDGAVLATPNGGMQPAMVSPRPRNVMDAGVQTDLSPYSVRSPKAE